jgi:hypothetical protein
MVDKGKEIGGKKLSPQCGHQSYELFHILPYQKPSISAVYINSFMNLSCYGCFVAEILVSERRKEHVTVMNEDNG